ncbi:MAG: DUF1292 domain-containing protein [Clostridia bacterium]|jgi:uncharacterized protein YrzB (UPF0473 family)|nr:DUF1292 domain-containing protein [Clostridia bacterium]
MAEMANDVVTLIDEDGQELNFELIDVLEIESKRYVVLQPVDADVTDGALEDDEAIILRLDKDENGEDIFANIEDDAEWDLVVNTYNDMLFEDMEDEE